MSEVKLKLNFLKRVLIDTVTEDVKKEFFRTKKFPSSEVMKKEIQIKIKHARRFGRELVFKNSSFGSSSYHTMIGLERLNNLEDSLDHMMTNNIKGDFMETGIWKGGACIFAKKYFDLYGIDRKVYACDSFKGLPKVDHDRYPQDGEPGIDWDNVSDLSVPKERVIENFKLYDCLDDNVVFIEGWFKDSLKDWNEPIGVLRMDGDMYQSTMDVLVNVENCVEENGIIIIDDYMIACCKQAVHDYFNKLKKVIVIKEIDQSGVWFLNKKK